MAQKGGQGAISADEFSSMRCRRTNGSRTSRRGLRGGHGVFEAVAIGGQIEAQGGDNLEVEAAQRDACGAAEAVEADDVEGVLSGGEQNRTWVGHGKRRRHRDRLRRRRRIRDKQTHCLRIE